MPWGRVNFSVLGYKELVLSIGKETVSANVHAIEKCVKVRRGTWAAVVAGLPSSIENRH